MRAFPRADHAERLFQMGDHYCAEGFRTADTTAYRIAEEWVRTTGLPNSTGRRFQKQRLRVGTKQDGSIAEHEFDAVSADGTIIAAIKASSGRTARNRNPSGKIKDAYAELLFLSLVQAPRKYLVLTDREFFEIFSKESDGKRPPGVELLHVALPEDLKRRVEVAKNAASDEVSP
jgi:hypothetical protein